MTGHYRMHRGWMDNPALGGDREPFCRRAAWAWLIENANWKAAKVDAGGTTIVVERGQLCASYRYLSKAWGWSLGKVQLFIDRLKTDTMINTAVNTGRMVITICNYEKYQATVETANTPSNTVVNTAAIREQYETKEGKKEIYKNGGDTGCVDANPPRAHTREAPPVSSETKSSNVVPIKPDRSREVLPLPDGWLLPDEWRAWAISVGWSDPDGSAERFLTHWLGKRDRGDRDAANSEAVWRRNWEGWIKGDLKRGHGHGAGRYDRKRRANGDLASVVLADLPGWVGYAEGGSDG